MGKYGKSRKISCLSFRFFKWDKTCRSCTTKRRVKTALQVVMSWLNIECGSAKHLNSSKYDIHRLKNERLTNSNTRLITFRVTFNSFLTRTSKLYMHRPTCVCNAYMWATSSNIKPISQALLLCISGMHNTLFPYIYTS